MRERLRQWWFWFTMPWTFRHLPQCYRNAITGLACTFDGETPPPVGKVWKCELFIDSDYMGLGMANLEDAETGKPAPEWEAVPVAETTFSGAAFVQTFTFRPKRLGDFTTGPEPA